MKLISTPHKVRESGGEIVGNLSPECEKWKGQTYRSVLIEDRMALLCLEEKTDEIRFKGETIDLEFAVISSFLNGYDTLTVEVSSQQESVLKATCEKIGCEPRRLPNNRFQIPFPEDVPQIFTIMHDISTLDQDIHEMVIETMGSLPNTTKLSQTYKEIAAKEKDVDKWIYLFKRNLRKSLIHPVDALANLGIKRLVDVLHYELLATYMERAVDLRVDIVDGVHTLSRNLEKHERKFDLSKPQGLSFRDYYIGADRFFRDALNSLALDETDLDVDKTARKAYAILKTRDARTGYPRYGEVGWRPAYIDEVLRKKILDSTLDSPSKKKTREAQLTDMLSWLQGKIWAITSIATNIAEIGRNMNPPESKKQEPS